MALESGFFNDVNGDRLYNADDMSRYFENIMSSGIFKRITDCLKVSAASGMTLTVAPGAGLINCRWFRTETPESVTIPTANAVLPRFDIVVARLDMSDAVRSISLQVVSGAPAATPTAPEPVRTADMHDLVLALVYVPAGASEITAANLTDVRSNEWYCGYVRSLVDTPVLQSLRSRYTAPVNNTVNIPINVVGYNVNVDILNVYIEGFRMAPVLEYSVDEERKMVVLAEPVDVGTVVDIEVYKPTMPDDIPDMTDNVNELMQDVTGHNDELAAANDAITALRHRVEELEADTGWIDIPWENGVSSNANWTARLRRVGKSIFLRGLCTGITAQELQVATIPEGFRPTMGGHAYASFCSSNTGTNTRAARMFINTDGGVIFRSTGSAAPASTDVVTISTSWLID